MFGVYEAGMRMSELCYKVVGDEKENLWVTPYYRIKKLQDKQTLN